VQVATGKCVRRNSAVAIPLSQFRFCSSAFPCFIVTLPRRKSAGVLPHSDDTRTRSNVGHAQWRTSVLSLRYPTLASLAAPLTQLVPHRLTKSTP